MKKTFRSAVASVLLLAAVAAVVARDQLKAIYYARFGQRVLVAVLDTGVDARIPALANRLARNEREVAGNGKDDDGNGYVDDVSGWNFRDANNDVADGDGHGTKMALHVAQGCDDCRILPLKLTKSGAGIVPDDVAKAIRYALLMNAKVINISFGVTANAPELARAVDEAVSAGASIVTAAGTGITNPFRAEALDGIYPQSYPHVIVVGAAKTLDETDYAMNSGPLLDLVVTGQEPQNFGSSYAAATVSGAIALRAKSYPDYGVAKMRALLRATATRPQTIPGGSRGLETLSRIGSGAFDAAAFHRALLKPTVLAYRTIDGEFVVDASGFAPIEMAYAEIGCKALGFSFKAPAPASLDFKKGRALFLADPKILEGKSPAGAPPRKIPAGTACEISVHAAFEGGMRVDQPAGPFTY